MNKFEEACREFIEKKCIVGCVSMQPCPECMTVFIAGLCDLVDNED